MKFTPTPNAALHKHTRYGCSKISHLSRTFQISLSYSIGIRMMDNRGLPGRFNFFSLKKYTFVISQQNLRVWTPQKWHILSNCWQAQIVAPNFLFQNVLLWYYELILVKSRRVGAGCYAGFNFKVIGVFIFQNRRLRMRAQVKTCAVARISVLSAANWSGDSQLKYNK